MEIRNWISDEKHAHKMPEVSKIRVATEVLRERDAQDEKWGPQDHSPLYWYSVLGEEFGEVGKALCEGRTDEYRKELIQVAAVAVAMVESLDRRNGGGRLPLNES